MSAFAKEALDGLLGNIGLGRNDTGGQISFTGEDPIVASRHRVGAASAAAIAAEAVGIAAIWRMRGGNDQDIAIDLHRAAVPGLRTSSMIWQNGYTLEFEQSRARTVSFFQTKDGRCMYLLRAPAFPGNVIGLMDLLKCSSNTDSFASAVSQWNAADLEEALGRHKLIGVMVRSRDEWLTHPQGEILAAQPPVIIEKIGDSPAEPFGEADRPLSGIRVLDLGNVIAGPVAARVLAEQGADILHLSAPMGMDDLRIVLDTGLGKRSAYIDLNSTGDVEHLKALIADGDILIQSYRPGSMAKRGLAADDVAKLRPGAIYASVSAYGKEGPWASRGGFDPVGQAVSGLALAEGAADQPLLAPTYTLNDYLAAYLLSAGIVAALIKRAREGGSYHVQVSLARCSMWLQELGQVAQSFPVSGDRSDRRVPDGRPSDFMETKGAFGIIRHARPIVDFSETKASWDLAAAPLGSMRAEWNPLMRHGAAYRALGE